MARYDRIARLQPPPRNQAFRGWLTLRDLEGREREPELGRRARLRFLALRPVQRLLRRGIEGPSSDSFQRQIDAVREELGQLPSRDPERVRLSEYLKEIGGRTPRGLADATLEVGAAAELAGHPFAAEEFYRTALEITETHALTPQRIRALRSLARVFRDRGDWDAAVSKLAAATAIADAAGDALAWARTMSDLATLRHRQGDLDEARSVLQRMAERGARERDDRLIARAAAGRCALELADGSPERAVEEGWNAVRLMPAADEDRNPVLLNLAAALRSVGLAEAAASAYGVVARWSAWPEHRTEAEVERAVVAAEAGDADAVATIRSSLLESLDRADPRLTAMVELGLGRASMLIGDVDEARTRLRSAIATARDADLSDMLQRAEELLEELESPRPLKVTVHPPSDAVRSVATRVVELGQRLVSTG